VLLECLERLEEASPTARYHKLAQQNVRRWCRDAAAAAASSRSRSVMSSSSPLPTSPSSDDGCPRCPCIVRVLPGDWGQVTLDMTREYGKTFACLNMANAYSPGGGYADGMVAQEENMFRRTDCHFSLERSDMDSRGMYLPQMTALLSGVTVKNL
jgi:hypothetical protein